MRIDKRTLICYSTTAKSFRLHCFVALFNELLMVCNEGKGIQLGTFDGSITVKHVLFTHSKKEEESLFHLWLMIMLHEFWMDKQMMMIRWTGTNPFLWSYCCCY